MITHTPTEGINIIGDVHGRYHTLLALLARMPSQATPVSVGDMIDRHPHGRRVWEYFAANGYAVRGNHESMFLAWYADQSNKYLFELFMHNGGDITMDAFDNDEVPADLLAWVTALPVELSYPDLSVTITHAPLRPALEPAHNFRDPTCWRGSAKDPTWYRGCPYDVLPHPTSELHVFGHNSSWGYMEFRRGVGDSRPYAICADALGGGCLIGVHVAPDGMTTTYAQPVHHLDT